MVFATTRSPPPSSKQDPGEFGSTQGVSSWSNTLVRHLTFLLVMHHPAVIQTGIFKTEVVQFVQKESCTIYSLTADVSALRWRLLLLLLKSFRRPLVARRGNRSNFPTVALNVHMIVGIELLPCLQTCRWFAEVLNCPNRLLSRLIVKKLTFTAATIYLPVELYCVPLHISNSSDTVCAE